ncbi:DUF5819 family protein [Curtobacterium aurantiacum]|uniref:Secreted protein n=1 Tax=Curtobacterium aurantiacum TaxID=3236919 RepID=A0ABS5VJE9_9MICO|nr:DUF5819 family protein [Curtobacterium flaccumfaciens]MBT1547075.1 hypothetical protein [Curtobacterium flaccumfaciens pv. flaccumfaciens]MBT1589615.1 hypothetical protein [Curtobacterium flaccumfaciens pv. flaccumfaciens]
MLTCWQVFASFLWIAPPTAIRQLVPGDLLERYMLPWFGQSWSVFAPDPINGDNEVLVRAQLRSDDSPTSWVNVTDVEYELARHNPFPPKAATMGTHQAASTRDAWNALTEPQQQAAGRDFTHRSGSLARTLEKAGGPEQAARAYVQQDEQIRAYATQAAYSIWGADVTAVQFRVQRHPIVPFADRNDPTAQRPGPIIVATGWRALSEPYERSDQGFRRTFLEAWTQYREQR